MNRKTVIILSGGMDSAVLMYDLLGQGFEVHALSFDYGQRHAKELGHAANLCEACNVPHHVVDVSGLKALLPGSSQTDDSIPVPKGHYEDENMKLTVVPNRNMIMLSIAMGHALAIGAESVCFAAHAGDHAIYPDCRPEFVAALSRVGALCHFTPVAVLAPYLDMDKGDIALQGSLLKVPFEKTWTCYVGGAHHCGKCGACQERREAFLKHKIPDPTIYLDMPA